jgi:phage-related protein
MPEKAYRRANAMAELARPKPLRWIASSLDDLRSFPAEVRGTIGFALWEAQLGGKVPAAKPLKGFGGAGVLEIVESFEGDAYRAAYTVRFRAAVYVLHAFQKKSRRGIATPKHEIDLIKSRLKLAQEDYEQWQANEGDPSEPR